MDDASLDLAAALPPDLLAAAIEALGLPAARRDEAFASLLAGSPLHAASLRQLSADLAGVERLLDAGYGHPAPPPIRLGRYRVKRSLGDGAFGEVFLCEQTEPVCRQVAVKVLRAGVGDRTTIQRFAAERQLIASLQHPAIAQVFDAGTSADGRPFFVMDAIDGTPLDRYCDEHALTVAARIDLFCDLCRGVQHAHEHGIVHRDLKPANVLVVEVDGRPRPKVIDFGIAKVLHGSRAHRPLDTEAGRIIGTPGYMSPEQQKGSSDEVDTRADVFCLGVMLYELLCGQLPWPAGAAATDTDPQRPSTRVSTNAATATAIARQRSTEPRRLASHLRGEIDWIVLRCLQRDRARRYQTAQELVDDLERHRRAEPVRARPPTTAYRLRKFAHRHRAAVTAIAGVAVAGTIGLVLSQQYRRAVHTEISAAAARADAGFAAAAAAVTALVERANDPAIREAPQGDATREAMLSEAVGFYDRFLVDRPTDPELRMSRCRTLLGLSHVHWLLGTAERATEYAQLARQEAEALFVADPTSLSLRGLLGEALCRHGAARSQAGDDVGALASFTTAIGHLAPAAAEWPAQLGCQYIVALRGAATAKAPHLHDERVQELRKAMQVLEHLRSLGPTDADFAAEFVLTACVLGQELRLADALRDAEAVLVEAEACLPLVATGRLHSTYRVSTLRAQIAVESGQRPASLAHYEAALAAAAAWEREQPQRVLPRVMRARAVQRVGHTQNYLGDFERSTASYREAIAIGETLVEEFPADPRPVGDLINVLEEFARTLYDRFRQQVLAEAATHVARAVALEAGRADLVLSSERWRLVGLQALIADACAAGGGDRHWPGVEAALPADPKPVGSSKDALVGVYAGLGRWHLRHGRRVEAAAALQRAEAWIARDPKWFAKRTVEVGWLTARLAFTGGDHAACAAAADRVAAARPTWYGRRRAGDCLHLAWRCARDAGNAGNAAAAYRQRALSLYRQVSAALDQDVAKDGSDPWFVVPWAIARIRSAELAADDGEAAALALLADALPRLEAVRADTHADQWDEQASGDGRALHARLAGTHR